MASRVLRRMIGSSLHTRVLLVIAAALAMLAGPAWLAFNHVVDNLVLDFGSKIAERQVQYDRYRGLETLKSEIALAETMSRAPAIIAWTRDENDPDVAARGLAEMEHYRRSFHDQSAFVIIDASGKYYYNDAQDSYGTDPYRYMVRSDNPRDGWYFATKARRQGCFANVDHDDVLRVTKVWINCIVSQQGQVLGMAGTGLDLSAFIREVVDVAEPGVTAMFVDHSGAVQAHRDASLVDFHSLTKEAGEKITIFSMLGKETDVALLRSLMNAAFANPHGVYTGYLNVDGHRVLAGVGFMDRIGWYNVTLMDIDAIVDRSLFLPVAMLLGALVVAAAFVLSWIFRVMVLDRLAQIERGLGAIRDGRTARIAPDTRDDEIGRLSRTLIDMAKSIGHARIDLETQVREQTEELQSLANLDAMTGIYNRRGFVTAFKTHRERAEEHGWTNGIMFIDIDRFKDINDRYGHRVGDVVAIEIARRLGAALRRGDVCARWGGDEFVVLIRECDSEGLRKVGMALLEMMRRFPVTVGDGTEVPVTVSIGAAIVEPTDTLDVATEMADAALYAAKENGRDRLVFFGDSSPEPELVEEPAGATDHSEAERESAESAAWRGTNG
ncbi:sensor domain-containing diguanylate cyclase [Pelagibacterium limicola]|uniref:sensor domain-containing diguanylate cyclase n=1 Tax=Pelagibacterium limicola TaxID=2791022 RepID=UPI001FE50D9A|nr:diguanylate cyclase [Pelagibacterium limicola]